MGRWRHRAPNGPTFLGSVVRKVATLLLAILVGFVILILVSLPLAWMIWQVMLYASRQ